MDDETLLRGFRAGTLASFPHRDHVRVAWLYLAKNPLEVALPEFCRDLRHFAEIKGATGLFHATITWAFLSLIAERREANEAFEQFAERNPDLFSRKPSILDRYYRPETLASAKAKAEFILPDRIS